ncbi:hypothetical protein IMZ48_00335, partial [Candidatus Bathyarchaeota archaeon]|nr:hypothetical protein [Candidatus Bathyarchaeota archaeon]
METSAPKRRRTSPRTSVDVGADNDAAPSDATPEPTTSPTKSPRRKRPDFASPTKASLARHNPEILARRRSEVEARRASRSELGAVERSNGSRENGGAASRPGSRESDVSLSELLTAQRPDATLARRSPLKPAPITRPLPPPAPEGEELVDPFSRRDRVRRSNQAEEDEPELPPTPSELGVDQQASTPPAGIHSESSPLKRRLAERERRRATQGSSPLKGFAQRQAGSPLKKGVVTREESPSPPDRMVNPQAREDQKGAHPARGVPRDREIAENVNYLEALRREEESLWSDLRLMAGLGREWAGEAGEVLPLVKRHPALLPQPEEKKEEVDEDFKELL